MRYSVCRFDRALQQRQGQENGLVDDTVTDAKLDPQDFWGNWDSFHREFEKFQEEVHTLILWPLQAALSHLKEEAEQADAQLEPRLSQSSGEENEYLIEQQQRNWQHFDDQERFLRNMALSRLIHTLRTMALLSEAVRPRKSKYEGKGELAQLWTEFIARFGFDFSPHQISIDYLDRLREVRNQIVHDGGAANRMKPLGQSEILADGTIDFLDTSFSEKYPEFVHGSDFGAEVDVSHEQLGLGVDRCIEIVSWVSEQLRAKEIEADREVTEQRMRASALNAPEMSNSPKSSAKCHPPQTA
jgi:hypothetical protein